MRGGIARQLSREIIPNELQKRPTSGLGGLSWNWMMPILAFSIRVGPPADVMAFWWSKTPSMSSVSSMVPPTFFTRRMSRRSTFSDDEVTRRRTASTAIGARMEEYCETICVRAGWVGQLAAFMNLRFLRWTRLGGETGGGGAEEVIPVREVDGGRHVLQVLDDLGGGARERLGDDRRVDALAEQLFGGAEERAGQDDDRGGTVSCFNVLCGREVDELVG